MTDLLPVGADAPLTMSSREIAELCDKEHRNVVRDIEKMLSDLNFDVLKFEHIYFDSRNRQQREFHLPKDLTITLVAGYKVALRKRIIDRWLELEGAAARPAEIDVRNPIQLTRIAIQLIEVNREQAGRIEAMREDVEAHARLVKADGSLCFRDAAKSLQIRPKELTRFLSQNRWIFRQTQNGPWLAYQSKIAAGLLEHKVTTVERSDGTEKMVTQCRVTPKGVARLATLVAAAGRVVA